VYPQKENYAGLLLKGRDFVCSVTKAACLSHGKKAVKPP